MPSRQKPRVVGTVAVVFCFLLASIVAYRVWTHDGYRDGWTLDRTFTANVEAKLDGRTQPLSDLNRPVEVNHPVTVEMDVRDAAAWRSVSPTDVLGSIYCSTGYSQDLSTIRYGSLEVVRDGERVVALRGGIEPFAGTSLIFVNVQIEDGRHANPLPRTIFQARVRVVPGGPPAEPATERGSE